MIRWKYVISRSVLLVGTLGLCWLLCNPLLRLSLIQGGQQLVGAKVEIGALRTRLSTTSVRLEQLRVADPRAPLRNLLEAERVLLDLDTAALLRRRLVIKEGSLEDVQLDTERAQSGALPGQAPTGENESSWADSLGAAGEAWLRQAQDNLLTKLEADLKSVALGKELVHRWPEDVRQVEQGAQALRARGEQLVQAIQRTKDNPLQSVEHYQQLLTGLQSLRRDSVVLKNQIGSLGQQMQSDRAAIEAAKRHDAEYVREHLQLTSLEPEVLSEYLLGPELAPRAQSLLQLVAWTRGQFRGEGAAPAAMRGIDILLPGVPERPAVLLERLLVQGSGTSGGQPFDFHGTVRDWTPTPKLHDAPMTLELETTGQLAMTVQGTLDRSGEMARDHFVMACPRWPQPARVLGDAKKLAFHVAPGEAALEVDLTLVGEVLAGEVTFRQGDVDLRAQMADDSPLHAVQTRLSQVTSAMDDLEVTVRLAGSLERPEVKIDSNLGTQLSGGLETALAGEIAHRKTQLVARASRELDDQIMTLATKWEQQREDLLSSLQLDNQQLAALESELARWNAGGVADKLFGEQGVLGGKRLQDVFR